MKYYINTLVYTKHIFKNIDKNIDNCYKMSESDVDVESVGSGSNSDAETETAADESQNESVHFSDDDDDDIEELMSPSSNNDDASVKEGVEGDQGGDRSMARARYSGARCRRIVRAGRSRSRPGHARRTAR